MKTPRQLGLIVEGNSTKSVILRYPGLADSIGPIKASVLSVARRVSNFIRAGNAVDNYEDFENCDLVLIRVPDKSVPRIVEELCASKLKMPGMSFLLCESWLPSDVLVPLKERGATVATLLGVPAQSSNWFALEGQYVAVKRSKKLLNSVDASTVELKLGTKHLYFAASAFAETLPRALFAAAQKSLRRAGVSGNHLYLVLEEMAQNMFRDISRGARAGWTGPLLDCPEELAGSYLVRLQQTMPELAALLSDQLKLAEPFMLERIQRGSKRSADNSTQSSRSTRSEDGVPNPKNGSGTL
jgi:predicted short-subunit dehydrogenase-like oxidoreductase (DUF2520 family)